ncbi:hypothetical protein A3D85_01540 [Candidatus Amesbacteria bacterium RIFCSPHIGHO2_02_FULL_47_9]|uniref:Nudix hydrolase domain-containing protein n=1 Tax=Candidatus Amesbacteria bacterium RIFCSPHIGHO2_01_FULL_48_32b TaxID=1797253 RepID=A0A1F4YD89_9BACT|nr:MAG: hypothetical protein A2876_04495 [Candidatus Amesbacteria bacterium RIFCSPHIGHO2_01_FULL_48_32b]OGD02627.1 MAG: hypothetical protein A3D85_01540 [Candidatus Amesbacteria bacterium RIFCSPHIGHO2_02_FULL_47_9]OGD07251.1 MAG: hypothetical protein A2899_03180 [Candidatus Amesbacteria bacterium RIFCSPLOWO2_01_FULL_49_25]
MTKSYRVSGFLFHEGSQQVLLHQPKSQQDQTWSMFTGEGKKNDPQAFFRHLLSKILRESSIIKNIYPVYSYFNPSLRKTHYIFYVPVSEPKDFQTRLSSALSWFTFKQISKLPLSPQAKHDIVIAQRVIRAQIPLPAHQPAHP